MREYDIQLTKNKSYPVKIPLGQGSLSIGTLEMNKKYFDVLVDKDLPIEWDCFNTFFTGHGKENAHLYPYGNWPRFFYYYGNDKGFIKWSEKREIESIDWCPQQSVKADFTHSKIRDLRIIAEKNHKIELILGKSTSFTISGNIDNVSVEKSENASVYSVSFSLNTQKDNEKPYKLPNFPAFEEVTSLYISVDIVGQPFDCESLLQFKKVKYLSLYGNITNLKSLSKLTNLENINVRYAPNLEDFPNLNTWEKLNSFIGVNIEESRGKTLKKELNQLKKQREMQYSTVSQLRKPIWFITEYQMPFGSWKGKNERTAVKSYKNAVKLLKKAKNEEEIKTIIEDFTKVFNDLPNMETSEREDIGTAISQLIQVPDFSVDENLVIEWFDNVRDY